MDNVTDFPSPPKRELLVGPYEPEWRVELDGRIIPLLTGRKLENGNIYLKLDQRFGGEFSERDAWQAAFLIANALAIGQGYPSYMADSKSRPFAPKSMRLGPDEPANG